MAASVHPPPPLGLRRGALTAYRWLLLAFLLAGAVQIFLAGLGVFSLNGDGDDRESAFGSHRSLGGAIAGIAVVILILALITVPGRRAMILSELLVLLTAFMQSLLAGLADNATVFGGLHVLAGC